MNVSATLVVEMDKLFIFAPDKLSHYSDIDTAFWLCTIIVGYQLFSCLWAAITKIVYTVAETNNYSGVK